MSFFSELKRRGVLQVGMAYIVSSWLIVQVADIVLPAFDAPTWVMRGLIVLLATGFPIGLLVSWFFDITSHGFIRTPEIPETIPATKSGGRLINYLIIAVLSAAVIVFTLDKFIWQSAGNLPRAPEEQSIAVLPLSNLSNDPGNDAFATGIHDDLLTQLSKISAFRTLSRTSVMQFSDTQLSIPEIASRLGASLILEGGVQRTLDRVRINAQLIDGETDTHIWAETYDRELTAKNIFAIQSDIARSIAEALATTLSPEEENSLLQLPTDNLQAYDAYVSGLVNFYSIDAEELERAIAQFTLATELDSDFASAWAGLCQAELARYTKTSDQDYFAAAEQACQTAVKLDDSRVEVHIAQGTLYRHFGQYAKAEVALQRANYAKAEQALEQALTIDAFTIDAIVELGRVLAHQNRLAEAEAELLRAQTIADDNWEVQTALFSFYYAYSDHPDRFERAAHHAARAASLRPDLTASWNNLGSANYMLHQYDAAADAWAESLKIAPSRAGYTNTGLALYYSGRFEESAEMQRRAAGIAPDDHRAWGRLADALRFIEGQREQAAEVYEHAIGLAEQSLKVNERDWKTLGLLAVYRAHIGLDMAARAASVRAIELSERRAEALLYGAIVAHIGGDTNSSLDMLEEAIAKDSDYRYLIVKDPDLTSLSNHERFQRITQE